MSSKRFAVGFFTVIAIATIASFVAAPHSAWGDWGTRGKPAGAGGPDEDEAQLLSDSRVQKGLQLAPVPLDLHGRNRGLVGLGSYLVNAVGGCNDCHTCPNFQPADDPYRGGSGRPNAINYLASRKPLVCRWPSGRSKPGSCPTTANAMKARSAPSFPRRAAPALPASPCRNGFP